MELLGGSTKTLTTLSLDNLGLPPSTTSSIVDVLSRTPSCPFDGSSSEAAIFLPAPKSCPCYPSSRISPCPSNRPEAPTSPGCSPPSRQIARTCSPTLSALDVEEQRESPMVSFPDLCEALDL